MKLKLGAAKRQERQLTVYKTPSLDIIEIHYFSEQGNFPVEEDQQMEYYDEICDDINKTGTENNFTSERQSEPEEEQILVVDENISDEEIFQTSED